jgi:hypothetical protein
MAQPSSYEGESESGLVLQLVLDLFETLFTGPQRRGAEDLALTPPLFVASFETVNVSFDPLHTAVEGARRRCAPRPRGAERRFLSIDDYCGSPG